MAYAVLRASKVPNKPQWSVKGNNLVVGGIIYAEGTFQYFPKDSKVVGEKFRSLTAVLMSLNTDA